VTNWQKLSFHAQLHADLDGALLEVFVTRYRKAVRIIVQQCDAPIEHPSDNHRSSQCGPELSKKPTGIAHATFRWWF